MDKTRSTNTCWLLADRHQALSKSSQLPLLSYSRCNLLHTHNKQYMYRRECEDIHAHCRERQVPLWHWNAVADVHAAPIAFFAVKVTGHSDGHKTLRTVIKSRGQVASNKLNIEHVSEV